MRPSFNSRRLHVRTFKPLALAVTSALAVTAWADESSFSVSGFGTVSAVKTDTNDAQFRSGTRQPNGADRSVNFGVDTKLGVQVVGKMNEQFSATVQVLSQKNRDGNFKPDAEWAFLKYNITPDLSVRGGRMGLPIFLISDYRNVGYANTWARPPVDVYSQVAGASYGGLDLIWKMSLGDNTLTVQPYLGESKSELPSGFDFHFKKLLGVNATYEMGSWLFRAGYVGTDITATSPGLTTLIATMRGVEANPALPASVRDPWGKATSELEIKKKKASFAGLGAIYDDGQLVFQGEYTQRRTDSLVEDTDGWYTTLGYRFGDFMPYVSYADVRTDLNHAADNLPTPTASLAGLKAAIIDTKAGADQSTTTVGVRWNAWKNVALKAQFDRVETEVGKDHFFAAAKPGFAGKSVNVYTVAVDFVF